MKIQELTVSERIILAEKLWDSVLNEESEIELTTNQKFELDKRIYAFMADHDIGSPWSNIKERIINKEYY